jgi:hypothetical protein
LVSNCPYLAACLNPLLPSINSIVHNKQRSPLPQWSEMSQLKWNREWNRECNTTFCLL